MPAIIFSLLLLAACQRQATSAATAPASLPAGWPVAELTLPAGAQAHALYELNYVASSDGSTHAEYSFPAGGAAVKTSASAGGLNEWAAGFVAPGGWQPVEDHVDGCLLPAGYTVLREGDSTTAARQVHIKGYLGADRRTLAKLMFLALTPPGGRRDEAFSYELIVLPAAMTAEQAQRLIDTAQQQ